MHPEHPDFQSLFAAEHVESLYRAASPAGKEGRVRLRAGRWLVAAGLRLAPELEPRAARVQSARAAAR